MTKQQYELIRNQPEIPLEIWYEFFLERGGSQIGLPQFHKLFAIVIQPGGTMVNGGDGQPRWIDFNSALNNLYGYYNQKFEI